MRPLPKIQKLYKKELSLVQHRDMLMSILANSDAILRLKDGRLIQTTLKSDGTLSFEEIEPYYEFNDVDEIRDWVETDNETFLENVVRFHTLKSILDGEDEPLK